MAEARRRGTVIFMAVVQRDVGYVLDVYEEEVARYRRELRGAIRGEFPTCDEAAAVVVRARKRPDMTIFPADGSEPVYIGAEAARRPPGRRH